MAVHQNGRLAVRSPTSLCLRVARDFTGITDSIPVGPSILIIGSPGSGKTTLLRDLIRKCSLTQSVAVVDERCELFPQAEGKFSFERGVKTDVLSGCPKGQGVLMVLRTMGPSCIAVDEVTHPEDCDALLQAGWCGVSLLATAHAASREDLLLRPVYGPLIRCGLFTWLVVLHRDKTWHIERMDP